MSVYKSKISPFWYCEFQIDGRRVHQSTKATTKKAALAVEAELKAKAKAEAAQIKRTGEGPLSIDIAVGRYWTEVGQHFANDRDTYRDLERLVKYFTPSKLLKDISDADVAALIAWRREQKVKRLKSGSKEITLQTIAPATVNRTVIVPLRAIFARAKDVWGQRFEHEPKWSKHWLKEREEIVRELSTAEASALDGAVRDDYALWFEFARLTGLRRKETLIRWKNITLRQVVIPGKGGKEVRTPITPAIRAILDQCMGHHPEFVFTYVCKRPLAGQVKGERYPVTPEGAKTEWRRLKGRSKVQDFRFHDIRHDVATKLLRQTGNLKLVQKALNHSNVQTTTKYAAVMDDDLAEAMARLSNPTKNPTSDQKKAC